MRKFKLGASFLLVITTCLVFGKVVLLFNYLLALFLHEMAHLLVASKRGYSLKQVKLDMFGLAVELNEKIDEKDQFAINIAGPLCNLLLCVLCLATYWLFPISYIYLNTFCFASLILAIFNLLPVYPLDGGKIFAGIIKNGKVYKILDCVVRFILATLFICAFIISCFSAPNVLFLVLSIFFLTSKGEKEATMSIFKFRHNKHFDKVVILKVDETETLFNLIKEIKSHHYTIFYVPKLNKYFDEDMIVDLSLKNTLTRCLGDLNWMLTQLNFGAIIQTKEMSKWKYWWNKMK